MSVVHS